MDAHTNLGTDTPGVDALAARLAVAAPSGGLLDGVDFARLSAAGRIDAVVACARHLSRAHALMVRALGALDTARGGEPVDCTDVEVAVALRWAPSVAQDRLAEAGALTRLFPETLHAVAQGEVWFEQARVLAEATATLDDQAARQVQARVLPLMPAQTTASTRRAVRRAICRIDPDNMAARHQHERARRRVQVRPEPDGMATLELYAAADTVAAMAATLTRLAGQRAEGDTRTLDQRRADTLAALVLAAAGVRATRTSQPSIPTLVHVVVSADTLLRGGHEPAELSGHGPITATHARQLAFAPGSQWRWLLAAKDGTLIHASPNTYTPTRAVARFVRLRDKTCAFPHCHMPATRCDLDHTVPFNAGGPTTPDNLHPLCRHHHQLKTRRQWTAHPADTTGTLQWTAPTGHTYTTTPHTHAT
ncbi:MAG TPA: DUF222 domain-containing protein [Actinocrinis sp.]|jgi:hypothetical protein|uniref:HNH endonuclease signature motif containing protein n=1 Tax=Actinocrinis sp. TaxID=1920516 RepID=UPI002DDCBBC9|nr:DUF222 domain-containing protein [Actinocrinis sp.]HEV3172429.1 DUF222 domain-containing protein [Actinocrinis sp.]